MDLSTIGAGFEEQRSDICCEMKTENGDELNSLRSMLYHAKHYKLPLSLTMLSMLALVGIQLLGPWLVRAMVSAVTDPAAGPDTMDFVARLALLALVVYFARGIMRFIRSYSAHVAGWHVVADVRNEVYRHLQRMSLRFYEDKQTGQLMSRTVNDSTLLEQLVAHAIPDVLINVLMLKIGRASCRERV